ncbi:uncharacterized protein LOC130648066 [Hydractinia symbiolongicarpus]|uniref:uncharacterized protein LOC130648066 n=1 Tax=Hydractinia symbiolongicarpus TaxID=13093 RepID=UPI0025513F2C|nr:uncharacterized protein LOC130648066 [Hydractinia symbiolongicarpus]
MTLKYRLSYANKEDENHLLKALTLKSKINFVNLNTSLGHKNVCGKYVICRLFDMPDSCCAIQCENRRDGSNKELSFYRFPTNKTEKTKKRRKRWIAALRRKNWPESEIQVDNARICSAHFVTGKKSDDPQHIDYIPSVFSFKPAVKRKSLHDLDRYERLKKRKATSNANLFKKEESVGVQKSKDAEESLVVDEPDFKATADKVVQTIAGIDLIQKYREMSLKTEIKRKDHEIKKLHQQLLQEKSKQKEVEISKLRVQLKQPTCYYNYLKTKPKDLAFLTGVPNAGVFEWIVDMIKENTEIIIQRLGYENHLMIVLMKIKLGLMNRDLSLRFGISEGNISKIFRTWIQPLALLLRNFIVWPDKDAMRSNLPSSFKSFKNCISIIDCTEIFIERPINLTARAQTYSNYKNHNTIKYLIEITPTGTVSFLSAGWGGRASDKTITINSGFLDLVTHGDCVLADRGFLVEEELATRGAVLRIPAFTRGKKQLTARDVDISRQIAHVRIHVERVIGRLKKFKILSSIIPITQVDLTDEIMISVCGLVNLNPSVVTKK